MIPDERRKQILELLNEKGYISVEELSHKLYVSLPTIRRDLTLLEKEGSVLRTHGGASFNKPDSFAEPFALRKKTNLEEKKYIGKIAASLIQNNDTLFITSSSTCLGFANHVETNFHLDILTNGMPLAHKLSENSNVTVECPAGIYNYTHEGIYGKEVEQLINQRHAKYCFASCNGLDIQNGITFSTDLDLTMTRACRNNCDKMVLLADHTKFNTTSISSYASLDDLNMVITDFGLSENTKDIYEKAGVNLVIAKETN